LDLLRVRENAAISSFSSDALSQGYIPKTTVPTSFSENRATLIDNIFCKLSNNFAKATTGVLTTRMSDHQRYFILLDYLSSKRPPPRQIKYIKYDRSSIENFKNELIQSDLMSKLDVRNEADPNRNYEIFNNILTLSKNKHLPIKVLKFQKHKHKKEKWITRGIINSIKFRDSLYLKLKKFAPTSPQYLVLKTNLNTYNKILKRNIKQAKAMYYQEQFRSFEKDIKNTWKTINTIISTTKNVKTLPEKLKIDGNTLFKSEEIANEFNTFFQNIGPKLASKIQVPPDKSFQDYLHQPSTQKIYISKCYCKYNH
jgi:hypothetical protein